MTPASPMLEPEAPSSDMAPAPQGFGQPDDDAQRAPSPEASTLAPQDKADADSDDSKLEADKLG